MDKKNLKVLGGALLHVLCASAAVFCIGWLAVVWAERGNRPEPVDQGANGEVILTAKDATIKGEGSARFENFSGDGNIGYWASQSQSLEWNVQVKRGARCRATIDYSLPDGKTTEFKIVAGESELLAVIKGEGRWATWQSVDVGELTIPEGEHVFKLIPMKLHQEEDVMNFVRLVLKPLD